MSESEANIQIESKLESEASQTQTEKGKERSVAGDQHSFNQIKHQDQLEDEIELKPLSSKRLESDSNLEQKGDEKEKLNQIAASQATATSNHPLSLSPDQLNTSTSTTHTYYPYNFNPTTNTFSFQSRSRTDPQSSNSNPIQIARSATTLHGIPSNTTTNHLHPSNTPRTATRGIAAQPNDSGNGNGVENEAVAVRRNMLRGAWAGFGALGRGRRYVLIFRIAIALAQVAAGITVLSLPTSLGDSFARPEVCDPEGMFVFLTLHVIRVICSIPIDIYLGLSPHRNSRARRVGAQGQEERERNRIVGNLVLDRKLSRLSDLFGFVHVVLFVVGNYLVYSSTECSKPPADSVALFWTSFSMLAISYFVILEIALLVFAVVFFLPALVALLRALGFAGNLVNPNRINPETGKVDIEKVDGSSKLYYFVPMEKENEDEELKENGVEGEGEGEGGRSSLQELRISMAENAWKEPLRNNQEVGEIHEASQIPLPDDDDEIIETSNEDESKTNTSKPNDTIIKKEPVESIPNSKSKQRTPWKFWKKSFTSPKPTSTTTQISNPSDSNLQTPIKETSTTSISHSYPFLPLPSHRSTCPICLDDYREPSKTQKDKDEDGNELEPLRLLGCNHALHRNCVDIWLTTVSGRCPVCQRPIDKEDGGEDGGENQA